MIADKNKMEWWNGNKCKSVSHFLCQLSRDEGRKHGLSQAVL